MPSEGYSREQMKAITILMQYGRVHPMRLTPKQRDDVQWVEDLLRQAGVSGQPQRIQFSSPRRSLQDQIDDIEDAQPVFTAIQVGAAGLVVLGVAYVFPPTHDFIVSILPFLP